MIGALVDAVEERRCVVCGRRLLWIMRAAGCCLGPFVDARDASSRT